jgi:hypothetical protein
MQRPLRLFLVEIGFAESGLQSYYLAWKDAAHAHWMPAGVSDGTDGTMESQLTADASAPTADSILRDLKTTIRFTGGYESFRSWDVSDRVGFHHPRIRRSEMRLGRIAIDGDLIAEPTLTTRSCGLETALISGVAAARLLFDELDGVLGVVEPVQAQMAAYGHRLRQLLTAACMEVESAWRSVLVPNSANLPAMLTTNHYARLIEPMKLRSWSVVLTRSIERLRFTPFANWDPRAPTDSLRWYSAYNATKHAREAHLDQAQLGHVLEALAAVYVMLNAQFGVNALERLHQHLFELEQMPSWEPNECYMPSPFDDGPWRDAPCFR